LEEKKRCGSVGAYVKAEDLTVTDVRLLLVGRQFLLPGGFWLILGRNEKENLKIESLAGENDTLLYMSERPGPTALLRCSKQLQVDFDDIGEALQMAAGLVVRYGKKIKGHDPGAEVVIRGHAGRREIISQPLDDEIFREWML
jgi:tRNA-uridine 2-sulfurtransferase